MVKIDIDGKSIVELRQQLKGLKNDLAKATDPAEMARLAEGAGKVKDKMTDINEQVAIFSAGSKFEQAGIALGQIGSDLGNLDFEGAAEKAQKLTQIVKTISFSDATKGLKDLGTTFFNLGKALLTNPLFLIPAAIIAVLGALGLLGPIIDGVMNAFKFLSDSVNAFLVSLGLVEPAIKEVSESEKAAAEAADKHAESIAEEVTGFKLLVAQLKNTNAGSKERTTLIKQINEQYGTTLQNIKDEKKFQEQLNGQVEMYLKYMDAKLVKEAAYDLNKQNIKDRIRLEGELADIRNQQDKADKQRVADGNKLNNLRIKEANLRESIDEASDRYDIKTAQRLEAERNAIYRQIAQLEADLRKSPLSVVDTFALEQAEENLRLNKEETKRLEEAYIDAAKQVDLFNIVIDKSGTKTKDNGKEIEKTTEKFEKLTLKLKDVNGEFKTVEEQMPILITGLGIMYSEMFALAERDKQATLKLNADTLQGKLAILEDQKQKELAVKDLTELEKLEIEKRYQKQADELNKKAAEESKQRERDLVNAKLQIATDGFNLVSNLADLFNNGNEESAKKAFNVNKAVGIAQATIQTYQAAQGAYLSQMSIPTPDAPVRASIAAGIAVAAGIANVANIAKTQYKSSTPPTNNNTNGNVPSPATPSFNLFGNNNNANTVNASNNQPINIQNEVKVKAYVSETEITDSQRRVARYQNSATL